MSFKKSKVEKKVAQLEGWKSAHYKEVARNRQTLERLEKEREEIKITLSKLHSDVTLYGKHLLHDKDGTKLNPVSLADFKYADSEALGNRIIDLYRNWEPKKGQAEEKKIGSLYGFDLFIRQQREGYEDNGLFQYRYQNILFADSGSGIKYMQSSGHPNIDNPKLAARYYINAIDKVGGLCDKYEKQLAELDKEIPVIKNLSKKIFDKDADLAGLKAELRRLEIVISDKIRENQLKALPEEQQEEDAAIKLDHSENLRPLRAQSIDQPHYPANGFGR